MSPAGTSLAALPSVDRLLRRPETARLLSQYGRPQVTDAIRGVLAELRDAGTKQDLPSHPGIDAIVVKLTQRLAEASRPSLRRVFNLTGTVLHTNLGRAVLPEEAVEAAGNAARGAMNLEFDLARGKRGERDEHVEALLCRLTGAEAATVVNNNAAAVLLVLNTLAERKEVPTSRGELIEIGGAFRLPDIMRRAGCRLREVGTTNRTHLRDYEQAIGPKTGLVMKVHTSNYEIQGFTAKVAEADLSALCRSRSVPFAVDLGSGSLIDMRQFGLPHEPAPMQVIGDGADIVTFSGDKLLGGPQAGLIVGRASIMERIRRNPLKRALRIDKMTMAALGSVLTLYLDPERLVERLPTLRMLTKSAEQLSATATRLLPYLAAALKETATVEAITCESQIGSGALPTSKIASAGIGIVPTISRRRSGAALDRLAAAFRALPTPVIGRIQDGRFVLDLRCLEDESGFIDQLDALRLDASTS